MPHHCPHQREEIRGLMKKYNVKKKELDQDRKKTRIIKAASSDEQALALHASWAAVPSLVTCMSRCSVCCGENKLQMLCKSDEI